MTKLKRETADANAETVIAIATMMAIAAVVPATIMGRMVSDTVVARLMVQLLVHPKMLPGCDPVSMYGLVPETAM